MAEVGDMKFCYVLSCPDDSPYRAMTYLSMAALRRLYPSASIILLLDQNTLPEDSRNRFDLRTFASSMLKVDCPQGNASFRSRFIKTQLRALLNGKLLFLDSDSLPLRPFDELFSIKEDFAAALDRNAGCPSHNCSRSWTEPLYHKLNWKFPPKRYYNSGVMYFNDTEAARRLGDLWHQEWIKSSSAAGEYRDQPSLNHCLDVSDLRVRTLSIRYNAVVDVAPVFFHHAKILHFYARGSAPCSMSLLGALLIKLEETGEVDYEAIKAAANEATAGRTKAARNWNKAWASPAIEYERWLWQALENRDSEAIAYHTRGLLASAPVAWRTWWTLVRLPLVTLKCLLNSGRS